MYEQPPWIPGLRCPVPQAAEPEEAARVGLQAVAAAEGLSSSRARDYLADLANRLAKHVGLPAVRDFTARAHLVLQS